MSANEVVTVVAGIGILLLQLAAFIKSWHLAVLAQRVEVVAKKSRRAITKKVNRVTRLVNGGHEALLAELATAKELIETLRTSLALMEQRASKGTPHK